MVDGGNTPQPDPLRPVHPVSNPLGALADLIGASVRGDPTVVATGITLRAQDAHAGDVFAALPGSRVHGATFAADAVTSGACAVLTDPHGADLMAGLDVPIVIHPDPRAVLGTFSARVYGNPSQHLQLIGITGTSGKTTTSYLVESALRSAGRTVGLIGTVGTRIDGVAQRTSLTTPEAPVLQGLLAAMLEQGVDTVVMEVSSHALSLGRVAGADFAIGAFTNLSQDHLDFHHTMDAYFAAKARLFEPDSPMRARQAVVCVDDEWGRALASIVGPGVVTVAGTTATPADWQAGDAVTTPAGVQRVQVVGPNKPAQTMEVAIPGRYNVANALLAVAVVTCAGIDVAQAITGIAGVSVPGRLERVDRGQSFLAVVDYAHKPAAVGAVLATLRASTPGRVAVVVGAGGNRDTGKRPLMGEAAARGADLVVITDDNPRDEPPADIRAAVLAGAQAVPLDERPRAAEPIAEIGDRAQAIEYAVRWARTGDVVVVAGKGHETGQEVAGTITPFDDRIVLAAALTAREQGSSQ
ncbi:UDP-N-acetylmuramoyl-L-alanyl-D-glutamate--2,6-diaminopimelate ligase [Williamsia sp. CHRR-6]|uniref:UDP-N-acetylmuramoyl-L-alanyl-D-glutamate--2, 6-diaminopimelate ligase n=1 Tax=Williamsia sp. CHRR-6 TaxID=2835871 RepID=UPI001BDB41BD|nr:UDP-N-acetylmuramoyl-L-alanyl-D-glutamate--2,6-diaminopimelate ligase [Williamsia sp. CHRR-6]MBT0565266.1 UDP-N-acetylmuramoyl-L-alanyl-D-glutamate--2,6-diaminopimelate ligase [Williamsia sp. CHRR-6]